MKLIKKKQTTETILVVDDDHTILKVLKTILERQHYKVLEAQDGVSALKIFNDHEISLVITDVYMPNITGIDLLTEIRKISDTIPVIVITGKACVDAAVECMKIGAVDYISKPFTLAKIEDTVKTTLEKLKLQIADLDKTTVIRELQPIISGYTIVSRIGEGNMGIVYRVKKTGDVSNKCYALKIYKTIDFSEKETLLLQKRFSQEAQAASRVKHPNIVEFVKYGLDENEHANYIVTEFIDGVSLKHFLCQPNNLSYTQKAKMLYQMADALSAIHKVEICHRDLKPANIMIDNNSNVKITDFGIAKLPDSMLTQKNDLMGSPSYMAPESFISSQIDTRADIFSLGIMGYEFLVGFHPFQAKNFLRLCYLIRNEEPPSPKDVTPDFPPVLEEILMKTIKKNLSDRYQSARELCEDLKKFIADNTLKDSFAG